MEIEEVLQTFIAESRELLQVMEQSLMTCGETPDDPETINTLFRTAHTIKGSAGLFGIDHIVAFTHVVESLLDKVRSADIRLTQELIAILLECRDHLADMVDQYANGVTHLTDEIQARSQHILARLQPHLVDINIATAPAPAAAPASNQAPPAATGDVAGTNHWHISLRFGSEVLRNGLDPLSFLRYLATMGSIVHIHTLLDRIPDAPHMDAETCYLGFEIAFSSSRDKATIEGAFDFVRDDSLIRILPPHSLLSEYVSLINTLPEEDMRIGEMLVKCGTLTQRELDAALHIQRQQSDNAKPLGEVLVKENMVRPDVMDAALERQKHVKEIKNTDGRFIRVDSEKLDQLINLIGELIIAGAGNSMIAQRLGITELQESTSILSRLVEEVRDTALNLRMVQIGASFSRFHRVVRDVCKELGKDISLVISGAETELDKTVVEKIGDPLTHLVRNAMDHGIEPVEIRRTRGKPDKGELRLNAYHDSGSIVIEVSDDGGGMDRNVILAKAIEKGLVADGLNLTDREVFNLAFEPGLSTAKQISKLSGRGVGMDVVRRNIQALRGSVEIDSRLGAGTTVRIRLPLTLAIIDGFLVNVGESAYVIPLDMVVECVELGAWDCPSGDKRYLNLRGEVLPYLRLHEHFEMEGHPAKRENVVVVRYAGKKAGLVVDKLLGEFQTVIKPLSKMFSQIKGIGGFTILGGGEVALILDVGGLINSLPAHQHAAPPDHHVALQATT